MNSFIVLGIKKAQAFILTWDTNLSEGLVYSDERDLAVLESKPMLVSANASTLHLAHLLENSFLVICPGKEKIAIYPFTRNLDISSP